MVKALLKLRHIWNPFVFLKIIDIWISHIIQFHEDLGDIYTSEKSILPLSLEFYSKLLKSESILDSWWWWFSH